MHMKDFSGSYPQLPASAPQGHSQFIARQAADSSVRLHTPDPIPATAGGCADQQSRPSGSHAEHTALDLQEVAAATLLQQLTEAFHDQFVLRQVSYESSIEGEHRLLASVSHLRDALSRLLENALQHTPRGGNIAVRVRPAPNHFVDICIEDTGRGISSLHSGLNVVVAIARAHQGLVWFESQAGQGGLFVLRLPVVKEDRQ